MSNETQHPTCLVGLRREIAETSTRLESRVEQVEQAFSSLGWETDQLRSNLKGADKDAALLQESNASLNARIGELEAALHTMFTPAQVCERVNAVHDEVMAKLSAERKELETVQLLLKQAREERDAARSERDLARNAGQQAINERDHAQTNLRNMRTVCQAQKGHIDELRSVGPALDILADMVKETQEKLEAAHTQRDDLDKDYGKLVGEYEDLSNRYEQLRNAASSLRPGEHLVTRVTQAEMLHQFKGPALEVLKVVGDMTQPAVAALQYGSHWCHRSLHIAINRYRNFLDQGGSPLKDKP